MIRSTESIHCDMNLLENVDTSKGLDPLVESLCASYNIPDSLVGKMKDGLESVLTEYLSNFLVENHSSMNESSKLAYQLDSSIDKDTTVSMILESIRFNGEVDIIHEGKCIANFKNSSGRVEYMIDNLDLDKLSPLSLVEAWDCEDFNKLIPLLSEIYQLSIEEV